MRWIRGKAERRVTAVGPAPIHETCMETDCTNVVATGCSYVDRRRRHCPTSWCSVHAHAVSDKLYCRRHATIVEPLTQAHETHLPDVDNRAPGLAQWISDRIEPSVVQLLRMCMADEEKLLHEPLRYAHGLHDGIHRWERAWKLLTHRGVGVKVVVEADEERDGLVTLRVGNRVASRVVPPWIDHREEGEEISAEFDRAERQTFYTGLVQELRSTLVAYYQQMGERVPEAITQPLTFDVDDDQVHAASWFGQLPARKSMKPVPGSV